MTLVQVTLINDERYERTERFSLVIEATKESPDVVGKNAVCIINIKNDEGKDFNHFSFSFVFCDTCCSKVLVCVRLTSNLSWLHLTDMAALSEKVAVLMSINMDKLAIGKSNWKGH